MDTFRFGRRLSLPSTIAIKHQIRMLMANDRAKKAEEEARAQLTDMPQMKVGKRAGKPHLDLGIGSSRRSMRISSRLRANGKTLW
jgi:hypothetical protein